MQDFKKLRVWHLAQGIALAVIEALPSAATARVPGLRNQAIRAAMSVPANIAEGCSRGSRNELAHFLQIAIASSNELESLLQLACDAKSLDGAVHAGLHRDLLLMRRMLVSLMRAIQRKVADDEEVRRSEASRMR